MVIRTRYFFLLLPLLIPASSFAHGNGQILTVSAGQYSAQFEYETPELIEKKEVQLYFFLFRLSPPERLRPESVTFEVSKAGKILETVTLPSSPFGDNGLFYSFSEAGNLQVKVSYKVTALGFISADFPVTVEPAAVSPDPVSTKPAALPLPQIPDLLQGAAATSGQEELAGEPASVTKTEAISGPVTPPFFVRWLLEPIRWFQALWPRAVRFFMW